MCQVFLFSYVGYFWEEKGRPFLWQVNTLDYRKSLSKLSEHWPQSGKCAQMCDWTVVDSSIIRHIHKVLTKMANSALIADPCVWNFKTCREIPLPFPQHVQCPPYLSSMRTLVKDFFFFCNAVCTFFFSDSRDVSNTSPPHDICTKL